MVDITTVVGIVMTLGSVAIIFGLTIKAMRRSEAHVKTMSDEIEAIISEAAAGQSEGLLPERVLRSSEARENTVAAKEDTVSAKTENVSASPRKEKGKAGHKRCASDFVPHQYREEIAA